MKAIVTGGDEVADGLDMHYTLRYSPKSATAGSISIAWMTLSWLAVTRRALVESRVDVAADQIACNDGAWGGARA